VLRDDGRREWLLRPGPAAHATSLGAVLPGPGREVGPGSGDAELRRTSAVTRVGAGWRWLRWHGSAQRSRRESEERRSRAESASRVVIASFVISAGRVYARGGGEPPQCTVPAYLGLPIAYALPALLCLRASSFTYAGRTCS